MINASIVTRWILFIVPILGLLWIPGILSLTKFPNAHVSHSLSLCCWRELMWAFGPGLVRQAVLVEHLVDSSMGR